MMAARKTPGRKGFTCPVAERPPSGKTSRGVPDFRVSPAAIRLRMEASAFSRSMGNCPERRRCQPTKGRLKSSILAITRNCTGRLA